MPFSAQKKVSELTFVYDVKITTGNNEPKMADTFDGAQPPFTLKGNLSRSEMVKCLIFIHYNS